MAFFDLPHSELVTYRPDIAEPEDFEAFWRASLTEAAEHELDVEMTRIDNRQPLVEAYDLSFTGFGGQRIKAWFMLPRGMKEPLPTIVSFIGYSGGRGMPFAAPWVAAGYAHLVMDTRGQGWFSATVFDDTDDEDLHAGTAGMPGLMTRGIADPQTYYYRRLYVDAARAVLAARSLEQVDASRIVVEGGSQGGALSIAAAGLSSMAGVSLAGALVKVPFMSNIARAITLTDAGPYKDLSQFLRVRPQREEQVLSTLSYFDCANLAKWADTPALFSVGLMDMICPPSTVFSAYNRWADHQDEPPETQIKVYRHAGHEGGEQVQTWEELGWLAEHL